MEQPHTLNANMQGKIRGNEERVMVARNYLALTDVICSLTYLFTQQTKMIISK